MLKQEHKDLKIAIVHDWLIFSAGAEKVLASILEIFPQADVFSLFDFLPDEKRLNIQNKRAQTSFLQSFPFAKKHYRLLAPLMPLAVEQFDMKPYDLVISSSHAVAKGVLTGPNQLHISYVHTPMRYAWDLQSQYLNEAGLDNNVRGFLAKLLLHYLRLWDCRTANGVDEMIANSFFTRKRIRKFYRREATVIYPPVDTDMFTIGGPKEDFYLAVGRIVPYKRMDLLVDAFVEMPDKKLVVIGDGPQKHKIKTKGRANIIMLGYQSSDVVRSYMQRARAFLFAAEEDFGITPVEAQSCGTPVIAYGRGGCLETIRGLDMPEPSGVFFDKQSVAAIRKAMMVFEANEHRFNPENCRKNALRFTRTLFKKNFEDYVAAAWRKFEENEQPGARLHQHL
jgi:glycosyltransferase involved in cell wall biosynthesis